MGSVSKERIWGETVRHAEQKARELRFAADVAACEPWNVRMKGYGGPAQLSPPIGDALNAGFRYLEIKCSVCDTHNTVDLTTLRRPRETPIWQLEQRMRYRPCSDLRGYAISEGTWYGSGEQTSLHVRTPSLGIRAISGNGIDARALWFSEHQKPGGYP